jgi:hypothetical protein
MDGMQGGRRRGRRLRRKEEAWGDVAETRFVQPFNREILLVDERDEGAVIRFQSSFSENEITGWMTSLLTAAPSLAPPYSS